MRSGESISMTTLMICGDPHGQFQHILDQLDAGSADAVILLGDLDLAAPLHEVFDHVQQRVPVYWIPGNHDTDSEAHYDYLFGSALAHRNLHGTIADIAGVRVAGLGGVFRRKVWDGVSAPRFASPEELIAHGGKGNRWRGGLPLRHRSTIFPSHIEGLRDCQADVLVTHEAPSAHPFGFAALTTLAVELGVQCAFHGHHHQARNYADHIWYGLGAGETVRVELQGRSVAPICMRLGGRHAR